MQSADLGGHLDAVASRIDVVEVGGGVYESDTRVVARKKKEQMTFDEGSLMLTKMCCVDNSSSRS